MNDTKRIYLFDNLKFLLIVLVVIGHFAIIIRRPTGLIAFIYSFHMPFFIFISGMFFKDKNVAKKIFSYITLYLLMKVVALIICSLFGSVINVSLFSETSIPWFILSLPIFILFTHLINKYNLNKKIVILFSILLSLYIGYDKSIGDFLMLSRIIVFFPFYYLGTIIDKERIIRISSTKKYKSISFLFLMVTFFLFLYYSKDLYFLKSVFTSRNNYFLISNNPHMGMIYRSVFYIFACLLSIAIINLCPNKKIPIISEFGSRTIQVYFYHFVLYNILKYIEIDYIAKSNLKTFSFLILSIFVTFIFLTKLFSFPTKQILDLAKTDNK